MTNYYHFIAINDDGQPYLGYGDGRIVEVGVPVTVEGEPVLCKHGLHASARILDALRYALDGKIAMCEVTLSGTVVHDDDKSVATERTILRILTAERTEQLLREFALWCALQVVDMWDAPPVVRQYLETGDESLRKEALAAASAAANAAWAAARAAWAAGAAARAARAAWAADVAAAWAAWAAARAAWAAGAAAEAQEKKLVSMFAEACK